MTTVTTDDVLEAIGEDQDEPRVQRINFTYRINPGDGTPIAEWPNADGEVYALHHAVPSLVDLHINGAITLTRAGQERIRELTRDTRRPVLAAPFRAAVP